MVVFDDVLIPWEDVLVYRDVKRATAFYAQSGFMPRYTLQSGTRLAVKLDFLCGLFGRAGLQTNGTGRLSRRPGRDGRAHGVAQPHLGAH